MFFNGMQAIPKGKAPLREPFLSLSRNRDMHQA